MLFSHWKWNQSYHIFIQNSCENRNTFRSKVLLSKCHIAYLKKKISHWFISMNCSICCYGIANGSDGIQRKSVFFRFFINSNETWMMEIDAWSSKIQYSVPRLIYTRSIICFLMYDQMTFIKKS